MLTCGQKTGPTRFLARAPFKKWVVLYDAATNDRVDTGGAGIRPDPVAIIPTPDLARVSCYTEVRQFASGLDAFGRRPIP